MSSLREIAPDRPQLFEGDPTRLRQILLDRRHITEPDSTLLERLNQRCPAVPVMIILMPMRRRNRRLEDETLWA
jgi:hypothetical protein